MDFTNLAKVVYRVDSKDQGQEMVKDEGTCAADRSNHRLKRVFIVDAFRLRFVPRYIMNRIPEPSAPPGQLSNRPSTIGSISCSHYFPAPNVQKLIRLKSFIACLFAP